MMKNNRARRILAVLTAVMMILGILPGTAEDGGESQQITSDTQYPTAGRLFAKGTVDTGDFEVEPADGDNFTFADGVLTITGGSLTVKNKADKATTSHRIVIDGDATVTLAGVNIAAAGGAALRITPGTKATLTLADGASNTVTGAGGYAGVEVDWDRGGTSNLSKLTINGSGSLDATGGSNSAGIGGSDRNGKYYGDIVIESGTVIAQGADNAAGIGSANTPYKNGSYKAPISEFGCITINGGTVKARGGNGGNAGAGIGGGNHADAKVVINGGDIEAIGGSSGGAGIGNSIGSSKDKGDQGDKGPGYYFVDIEINGGTIVAKGGSYNAAGIGGGMYGDAIINITGGTITATGGAGNANYHHGGAGIGGGYEGHARVTISGGVINATGGGTAAGIGSGGSPNGKAERENTGRGSGAKLTQTTVTISAGSVTATAGARGGAGIGGSNGADTVQVIISNGTVNATGSKSSRGDKKGGAGIGSGYNAVNESGEYKYMVDSATTVSITGGNVTAIGGWGAAGVGSGAENKRAAVEVSGGTLQAYSDGTKFALDTRDGNGSTLAINTTEKTVLQGTFMLPYNASSGTQDGEGLNPITVTNDGTGESKELTRMPDGYRSFATNVAGAGDYTIYTDDSGIASGNGAYFSASSEEGTAPANKNSEKVQLKVESGKLSDNFFLYPVKTIAVEKEVEIEGGQPASGVNGTFWFRLKEKGKDSYVMDEKSITVKDGKAQNKVYFVNVPEGSYSIIETDGKGGRLNTGTMFGTVELKSIETRDSHSASGDDNTGVISETAWSDQVTVINTFGPSVTAVRGTKVWEDGDNQDGIRPARITVRLLADGKEAASAAVTADANGAWAFEFTNLPKAREDGKAIVYTVTEDEVTGYTAEITGNAANGFVITNTHTPETIDIPVTKIWQDGNNQDGLRPANITINLLANGTPVRNRVQNGTGNRWNYTFTNLPRYAEGEEITYTVTENAVAGYTTAVTGNVTDGFTITNTHTPEVITISGTKTWNDENDADGIRPASITVNLLADGRTVSSAVVTDWTYSFSGLSKYVNGREIVYSVTEDEVAGYTAETSGYDLINTHVPERVNISGTKTWGDHDDADGIRPESITVRLLADGVETASATVTGSGNKWSFSFSDLPGYRDGRAITYTVTEDPVEGYETTITGYDIYNIHESEVPDPQLYTLTVRYWADGQKAFPDHHATHHYGDAYNVVSPEKPGYTVDLPVAAGVIIEDTVIDVYYTRRPVHLTIYYQFMDGTTAANTYTATHWPGDAYDVASPVIEGYTATRARVDGIMPNRDAEFVVWYLPMEDDPETGLKRVPGYNFIDEYGVPLGVGTVNRNSGETVE